MIERLQKVQWKEIIEKYSFILIIILGAFSVFYNLTGYSVIEWDEARNGVNALSMLKNHDWLNYYYCDKPDIWNAKPPLYIWLLCFSFAILGKTVFALRFVSALATLGCIIVVFKTSSLFIDKRRAFIISLILITSKGFLFIHTGRTGDFDALNCFFLLVAVHFFLSYTLLGKQQAVIYCGLFTGLAFLTKGTACLLLLPSFLFFLLITKKFKSFFSGTAWLSGLIVFLIFPLSYFILMARYGTVLPEPVGIANSTSSVYTLLIYDTFSRIMGHPSFNKEYSHASFFIYLHDYFARWYLFFYLSIILLFFKKSFLKNHLVLYSFLVILSVGVFYSFMHDQNYWYLMPIVPFLAIFISETLMLHTYLLSIFTIVFLMSAVKQFNQIGICSDPPRFIWANKNVISHAPQINCLGNLNQAEACYLYMLNDNPRFHDHYDSKHGLWLINKNSPDHNAFPFMKILAETEDFILAEV